eukprot:CAMPEP_0117568914 /NCGR_PEP_ID=MMETSP0784-20121206/58388_1 /TAXON_ID=39447 /ORGANISM="" /LENGTH=505 /DNA_ID=CAMNT_0005366871 /DNA_START=13 /DNA_END=1530 /DNA_ORIENTATION=-
MRDDQEKDEEVLPYSPLNEMRFFFGKGVPLGLSAVLNWGVPPFLGMIFAGHTVDSAHLQTSLGYARVWFNCTLLMPCFGMNAYFSNVIPGCIGAGREDRIPRYVHRSMLLSYLSMAPIFVLQFFSGSIMRSLGVPAENCADIDEYCRWMVIMAILLVPSSHLESVFINLGFAKSSAFNSFVTGLGVDVACTYVFILTWQWGVFGAAMAQITVQASRLLVWLALLLYFKLSRKCCVAPAGAEPLVTKAEVALFFKLAVPQMLSFFAGWLIFEFQLMAMTNIDSISTDALAAGAAWVQVESSLAAAQDGWISSANMRVLNLLGKQDAGAPKALVIFNVLAVVVVCITNVPFLISQGGNLQLREQRRGGAGVALQDAVGLSASYSDQGCFDHMWHVVRAIGPRHAWHISDVSQLLLHCNAIGMFVALTNRVTQQVAPKMVACVGLTTVAQIVSFIFSCLFFLRLDWREAGAYIHRRANMDKRDAISMVLLNPEVQPASANGEVLQTSA